MTLKAAMTVSTRGRAVTLLAARRAMILFAATLALGACSLAFREPQVTLDGFRVGAIGLRGGTLVARVHIINPNGYDLRSDGLRYAIEIADGGSGDDRTWREFAEGEYDEEIRVPAGGDAFVEIPIDFGFSDMSGVLRNVLDRGTVDYRVSGTVDVEDPVTRTVPYRHAGQVTLSGVH